MSTHRLIRVDLFKRIKTCGLLRIGVVLLEDLEHRGWAWRFQFKSHPVVYSFFLLPAEMQKSQILLQHQICLHVVTICAVMIMD